MVQKLFPDPLLKIQNWVYLWINCLKFYTVCFYYVPSWGLSKYIETLLQTTCLPYIKFFKKTKRGLKRGLPVSLSAWFSKNIISLVIFYCLVKFYCLVAFTLWDFGQYVYCNCDVKNFETKLVFLIKPFFLNDQKVKTKI